MIGKGLVAPWIELVRSLGQSYLDLLAAEWAEVKRELALSGRRVLWAAAFFGAAAAIGFWLVALMIFLLVAIFHVWLSWWASAAIVTGLVLLEIAVLGWLGYSRLRKVENPVAVVGRRYQDHLDWWDGRVLAGEGRREPAGAAAPREDLP
ncbi:MAG TPA: phage holin family protein [Thermoanaerobaculia bacterium]|nr:phage holin family protein [Thermoanaerobaculia bacterium]